MSASSSPPPQGGDLWERWRKVYEAEGRAWSDALERVMAAPELAAHSGKLREAFASVRNTVRDSLRASLESVEVPTRQDVARLEEKIDRLADRLEAIEARLRGGSAGRGGDPTE